MTYFAENPPHFNLDQSPRFPGGVYIASGMRKSAKCIGCADSSISITISPKFSFVSYRLEILISNLLVLSIRCFEGCVRWLDRK